MSLGTGTIHVASLCILAVVGQQRHSVSVLLGAGTATASAPRAGAMCGEDNLHLRGYPECGSDPQRYADERAQRGRYVGET